MYLPALGPPMASPARSRLDILGDHHRSSHTLASVMRVLRLAVCAAVGWSSGIGLLGSLRLKLANRAKSLSLGRCGISCQLRGACMYSLPRITSSPVSAGPRPTEIVVRFRSCLQAA